jgi:hypothetical protein
MTLADIAGAVSPNPLADMRAALASVEQLRAAGGKQLDDAITWLTTAAHAVLATSEPQPVVLQYDQEGPTAAEMEQWRVATQRMHAFVIFVHKDRFAELRLDAPAMVGNVRFKEGVSWSVVIDAAKRLHAREETPVAKAARAALFEMQQLCSGIYGDWKPMPPRLSSEMRTQAAAAAREYLQRTGGNSLDVIYEALLKHAPALQPET